MGAARSLCLAIAVSGLMAATPASADDAAAEAAYSEYQQSIEVARKCRKLKFDQDQELAMGGVINGKIQHKIGAKRLSLLTAAQRDARKLVKKKGCKGTEATRLLGLFDRDLAPALN